MNKNEKKKDFDKESVLERFKIQLNKSDVKISDIDLFEINEAFAPVPLAWAIELNAEREKLNVKLPFIKNC